ncbi:nucleoside-diphosphate-sugar epimerase [Aspergillus ibericus CBS 121593]|uniref:Nucleoside-diphosphate-sugar epimerase n=1 Tax=Aspergillus ibericus CBS 121593 TaxID=1448316 RepID=A0A395GNI9_9EURO|nr:nucleoside-diphosphate-sugar epimerase [Aspergillus ibericus CBS 121593]RAK95583.1 nucleoside-diphosphate-sugar epimerase [Aspergillus ibericus CBS 121593]
MTTLPKIFITGATGYIGGDALYALFAKHPEYSYTALVRSSDKAQQVQAQYPSIRVVIGDLDDSALLEKESAGADIVLHTADASDHEGAAKAIAAGLAKGHSKEKPGYWLHTGGTGILTFHDTDRNVFGEHSDKVYDDWDHVDELLNLPEHAFHRNVDRVVLETGKTKAGVVQTALICPPTIYGRGRGPVSQRGRQAYALAKVTLQLKKGPIIGPGKAIWNNIHVHDLSDLYVLLVEAAVQGREDPELWGARAYYLTENGEHVWGELAKATAQTAVELGLISEAKAGSISLEDAKKYAGYESLSWGMNSRGRARRGSKVLGWTPSRPSLEATLPEILEDEVARL